MKKHINTTKPRPSSRKGKKQEQRPWENSGAARLNNANDGVSGKLATLRPWTSQERKQEYRRLGERLKRVAFRGQKWDQRTANIDSALRRNWSLIKGEG